MITKNKMEIEVDYLIALCNIIDNYSDLKKDAIEISGHTPWYKQEFLADKDKNDIRREMEDLFNSIEEQSVSNDQNSSKFNLSKYPKKLQKFYSKYKDVLDIINNYTNSELSLFMEPIYNQEHYNYENEQIFDFFYEYILNHRENLDKILSVLNKIKQLEFKKICLDENLNFVDRKYRIYTEYGSNANLTYLDNMIVIPTDMDNTVLYTTTGSNYEIKNIFEINVNSLVFDENRLPETISEKTIFDKIMSLYNEKKEVFDSIKKIANAFLFIFCLTSNFNSINELISETTNLENEGENNEILQRLQVDLNKFKNIINSSIEKKYSITQEEFLIMTKMYLEENECANNKNATIGNVHNSFPSMPISSPDKKKPIQKKKH